MKKIDSLKESEYIFCQTPHQAKLIIELLRKHPCNWNFYKWLSHPDLFDLDWYNRWFYLYISPLRWDIAWRNCTPELSWIYPASDFLPSKFGNTENTKEEMCTQKEPERRKGRPNPDYSIKDVDDYIEHDHTWKRVFVDIFEKHIWWSKVTKEVEEGVLYYCVDGERVYWSGCGNPYLDKLIEPELQEGDTVWVSNYSEEDAIADKCEAIFLYKTKKWMILCVREDIYNYSTSFFAGSRQYAVKVPTTKKEKTIEATDEQREKIQAILGE